MCCTPSTLLLLSLASILSVCSSDAKNMLPSEVETIFKIMESISSDKKWRISYPNPCNPGSTWLGIECKLGQDNRLHVSRLDFGTRPNPTCKNTATFPYEIFDLPHLQSVFFFQCFTRTKTTLSASPNRGAFFDSSLQQLSLRSNPALVGPIPPQISFLKSLEILTLSQNRLSGRIPVGIFSLNSLVHLDLSYNMLTGPVPIQLGNLNNLQGLDLSYNSLTGPIPGTIGRLGMLQKLDLSSNSFIGTIPYSIEKLTLLTFMALSNNKLRGSIPKGILKLQSLQYFIMDDNPMYIPLPAEFGKLVKLQELRLANSCYSGTIPPSFSLLVTDFVAFINEKAGTSRDGKGQLTSKAGIVESLDVLVKEFVAAGDDEKKAVFSRIEEEVEKLKGSTARHGKIYLKAAKTCMVKGADYAKNEIERLQRILEKSISPAKADEFTLKKNILSTFA